MRTFLLISMLLFTQAAVAETKLIEKQPVGFGNSYQDAVSNALLTAVRQVRGLEIGTEQNLKSEFNQFIDKAGNTHSISTVSKVTDVYEKSKGWVKSYEVISVTEPENQKENEKEGIWKVKLNVLIPQFESRFKQDDKIRVAIMPFRINSREFNLAQSNATALQISKQLAENITSKINHSRKVIIVNRSYVNEMAVEKDLLSSDNVAPEEASRIGQMLGADLMIVGNIHEFKTETEARDFYGMDNQKLTDTIAVYFSSVETATGNVISSNTKTYEYIRARDENTVSNLLNNVASLISKEIIKELFPNDAPEQVTEEKTESSSRELTPGSSEKPFRW